MGKIIKIRLYIEEIKSGSHTHYYSFEKTETFNTNDEEKILKLLIDFNERIKLLTLGCRISIYIDKSVSYNSFFGFLFNNCFHLTGYNPLIIEEMNNYYEKPQLLIKSIDINLIQKKVFDCLNN
jgi:hypothetical protein